MPSLGIFCEARRSFKPYAFAQLAKLPIGEAAAVTWPPATFLAAQVGYGFSIGHLKWV